VRAIRISEWGGPEVLELVEDAPMPEAGEGMALVHVNRAGVNYADTHQTENAYLARYELPLFPGAEVAGTTEDGRRVVGLTASGGYAEWAAVPEATILPIADGVTDGQALALLVQGLTAWHLYRTSARMREGESVVVHAAAGGVGSLAVQLGKAFGAGRVIATASSEEKRELALDLGADVAVDVTREDLADALREMFAEPLQDLFARTPPESCA
jgi:NADPH:quinone reductase